MLALTKPSSCALLLREAQHAGLCPEQCCPGVLWLRADSECFPQADGLCFAHTVLLNERLIPAGDGATAIARMFCDDSRGHSFEGPWPLMVWDAGPEQPGRVAAAETALRTHIKKRMARVVRQAAHDGPGSGVAQGLFVVRMRGQQSMIATRAWLGGQQRMRDDARAPSRSFLKVEEAYRVLGRMPGAGESVVDLGAAPGGWSYSAASRGATVTAVDNGPLKAAAAANPLIRHVRQDAFGFRPAADTTVDWLLCDMLQDAMRVLALVERWIRQGWCRTFIVNLKTGRADAVALLQKVMAPRGSLRPRCSQLICRELYHNRDEITLMGALR